VVYVGYMAQRRTESVTFKLLFTQTPSSASGPGSVVGIATGYGLDGPGIESRWGRDFSRASPDRPWGPPSLLYNGYRVFPRGKERPGRDADPLPPSSAVGHERVELYLYSPYGSYGLYRASVPVQWCTLTFLHRVPNLTEMYSVLLGVQHLFVCHVIYRICCIDKMRNYRLRTLCTQTDQDRI